MTATHPHNKKVGFLFADAKWYGKNAWLNETENAAQRKDMFNACAKQNVAKIKTKIHGIDDEKCEWIITKQSKPITAAAAAEVAVVVPYHYNGNFEHWTHKHII